ncbi:MAG TPA: glycoside hydrolase family 3 N-terminal domain-containing protein [Gemmatimonadales bacterium]|jgi:beta-glucosidase-like glycosyl hydrolase|nr:glycoside hydrolase family 3 N-terminal domain-containing protein [Gemmatimonadales bacterium]
MTPGTLVFPALRWRPETGFAHEAALIAAALEFGAGGFILFGGTADAVFELTRKLRRDAGRSLLVAADLERGPGQQVVGLDELPPPRALASLNDPAVLRGAGVLTALEALSVGINWILAPVADLDIEAENPIVQTRAFGADPAQVAAAAAAWIVGCEAAGALACAKHFPGHGRTRSDSHEEVPVVTADAELLRRTDLQPFRAAVLAGVSSIMTAHVAYPALDPSGTPATFSAPILRILREELGFGGVIASDALMMEGARAGRTAEAAALAALAAGVDLLLYPDDPAAVAEALTRNATADASMALRVEQSLERYQAALEAAPLEEQPERLPAAGSSVAAADWLLSAPLLRGEAPRLRQPLELIVVDDDLGGRWPASPNHWVKETLAARGVALGPGGSKVVLAFAEPRASKGRAGFGAESRATLLREAPGAAQIILFAHPRLLAELPGDVPVLLAWHRQRLMQEAAARWLAERLG